MFESTETSLDKIESPQYGNILVRDVQIKIRGNSGSVKLVPNLKVTGDSDYLSGIFLPLNLFKYALLPSSAQTQARG